MIVCFADSTGLNHQLQPITGLVCFFQSDFKLCNEVRFAVGVLRLMDVRADGGSRSCELVYQIAALRRFYTVDQIYDTLCKIKREIDELIFCHLYHQIREKMMNDE